MKAENVIMIALIFACLILYIMFTRIEETNNTVKEIRNELVIHSTKKLGVSP